MCRLLLFVLPLLVFASQGEARSSSSCLDGCECDFSNKVILCGNGGRKQLRIPSTPLSDFEFIDLSCNELESLPAETLLLAAFPDLKGVDLEGNPLDCSLFKDDAFSKLATLTNCDGKPPKVPCTPAHDDEECDWKCKGLRKLKEWWLVVRNTVRDKYYELEADKLVEKVSNFFSSAFKQLTS